MLQALRDTVIVKPIFEEYKGKIIIPKYSPHFKQYHGFVYGVVISIGKDYPYKDLKVGDKVIFQRHEGKNVYENRELFIVLKERWVGAIYAGG